MGPEFSCFFCCFFFFFFFLFFVFLSKTMSSMNSIFIHLKQEYLSTNKNYLVSLVGFKVAKMLHVHTWEPLTHLLICTYSMYSCEITWEKNNLLEDEMKVQIKLPFWPSQIPDLAKFLFGLRRVQTTPFIATFDTTTKFVKMTISLSRNLRSRGNT